MGEETKTNPGLGPTLNNALITCLPTSMLVPLQVSTGCVKYITFKTSLQKPVVRSFDHGKIGGTPNEAESKRQGPWKIHWAKNRNGFLISTWVCRFWRNPLVVGFKRKPKEKPPCWGSPVSRHTHVKSRQSYSSQFQPPGFALFD